ncbi:MAG: lipopolysaccharide heptosyltransferase family protein [Pseudomonadota bacterium]|nr:lipopolysaccharide heptosyltransferase family protein [Pseudomonadota bacterium]
MFNTHSPVVIRFGRLGDTILLQPLLKKLHLRYGRPCQLLTLGDWSPVLYSMQEEVGGFMTLRSQSGPLWLRPQRVRAAWALRALRQSPFYIGEPEFRTRTKIRPMLALAGVPVENCSFIEDVAPIEEEHWVDWLLRFGDTTPSAFTHVPNLPMAGLAPAPHLRISDAEQAEADAWMRARGVTGRPLVLLQPANKRTMRWNGVRRAADDDKSWPAERWAALAGAIANDMPQAQVLVCGSSAEAGYLDAIVAAIGSASNAVMAAALPLGCMKGLLGLAHSMVSVDTGPAHLAAAVGCPLVVLMGSRSPQTWMPRSASGSAVTLLGGLPRIRRVDELGTGQVIDAWRVLASRSA